MNPTPESGPPNTLLIAMRVASARIEDLEAENRTLKSVIVTLNSKLEKAYEIETREYSVWSNLGHGLLFLTIAALYLSGIVITCLLAYEFVKQRFFNGPTVQPDLPLP